MKAGSRAQIERALRAPGEAVRLYLLSGPDEAGSRALAAMLGPAMGEAAERVDLAPATLRQDPALLADEAAAVSLFGGQRWIRVEGAGEECLAAAQALLEAPAAGNPVVMVAGSLRKDSKLLALALASDAAMSFVSWPPDAQDMGRIVAELARGEGLQISLEVARLIAAGCDGDRGLAAREIEKLALYADAAPDRPREIDVDAVALLGADVREGDHDRLVELVLDGRPDAASAEITRLAAEGQGGIPMLRRAAWRLLQLAPLRAAVEEGESVSAAVARARPPMRRDARAEREVNRWRAVRIAAAIERLGTAQRALMASGSAGQVLGEEAMLAIARGAARDR